MPQWLICLPSGAGTSLSFRQLLDRAETKRTVGSRNIIEKNMEGVQ